MELISSNPEIDVIENLFHQQHLLIVGDVMVDKYVLGTIDRISPEAPVPVFKKSAIHYRLGGAGNVAHNVQALGGKISFISVVGEDPQAGFIQDFIQELQPHVCHLIKVSDRSTTLKTRYISHGQQIIRIDDEQTSPISSSVQEDILGKIKEMLPSLQGVILSDYNKGVLTLHLAQAIIDLCRRQGIPTFVDPKSPTFEKYRHATWITPNRHELSLATQCTLMQNNEVHKACLEIIKKYNLKGILATRSEQGLSVITPQQAAHLPTEVLDIFDVSGAGDTVLATFALAITSGLDPVVAADLSNHSAGVVVAKSGTATVTFKELKDHKLAGSTKHITKILNWQEAERRVFEWRTHQLRIGFTNGCFDILHPGHIKLLREAKKYCDRLIVGLNSDASIKRLKGEQRPINDLLHRSHVLEALKDTDLIVTFEEDTPLNLINYLKPDVLFKGSDYTLNQVVGAKEMASWGGTVHLLELVEGHSTTSIIQVITDKIQNFFTNTK